MMFMEQKKEKLSAKDIALIGVMVAVIEVCKLVLMWAPNIELTSFWLIMFALFFGRKVYLVIPVFILIEGAMFGIHLWWIMYLYVWPLLVILARAFRKMESAFSWAIFSGLFGLCFGLLCSFVYFITGSLGGSLVNGVRVAFAWWVAGIPMDLLHGVANFIIMLVLYHPITSVMKKAKHWYTEN